MYFTENNMSIKAVLATGVKPDNIFKEIETAANQLYGFYPGHQMIKLMGLSAIGSRVKGYPGYNSDYDFFGVYAIHTSLAHELHFPGVGKKGKVLDLEAEFQINYTVGGSVHISIRMLSLPMWTKMISQGQYDNCLAAHHPALWRIEGVPLMHACKTYADECIDLQKFYHIKQRFARRCFENTREDKLVGEVDSPSRAFDYFHSLLLLAAMPICKESFSGLYRDPKTLMNIINLSSYWKEDQLKVIQALYDCGMSHYANYSHCNINTPAFNHRKVFKDLSIYAEVLLPIFDKYTFEKNDEVVSNRYAQLDSLFNSAIVLAQRPWKISEIF